jgi:hypothetical protein
MCWYKGFGKKCVLVTFEHFLRFSNIFSYYIKI